MDKKLTSIKERVLQIPEYKGIAKEDFFNSIDMTYGNFKGANKKRPLNSDALENILTKYPDVNSNWLLTGKGSMLKEESSTPKLVPHEKGVPLIPIEAMAGWAEGDTQILDYHTDLYKVPEFDDLDVDFMIRVKGSSMYPKYNSGDVVACKRLPMDTFFQWNKVYVLDTSQGAMIKRLMPSEKPEHLKCVSDNEKYLPFDIPLEDIYHIAIVLGVIRLE